MSRNGIYDVYIYDIFMIYGVIYNGIYISIYINIYSVLISSPAKGISVQY